MDLEREYQYYRKELDDLHRRYGFALRRTMGTIFPRKVRERRERLSEIVRDLAHKRWQTVPLPLREELTAYVRRANGRARKALAQMEPKNES